MTEMETKQVACEISKNTCGPAKSDYGLQLAKYNGVDDAAETATRRGQSSRESFFGGKVLMYYGDRGNEEAALP